MHRLKYLDFIKGFAILLVVLGHVIQFSDSAFDNNILFRYIYSFHMPLFMFISGFSSSKPNKLSFSHTNNDTTLNRVSLKSGLSQIRKRFLQLLIPFFAWFIIGEFVQWRFEPIQIIRLIMNPEVGLWFLWCLFFISTIFTISFLLIKKNSFLFIMLISVVLFGVTGAFDMKIWGLKLIAYYNLFYLLGYFVRNNLLNIAPILMKYSWVLLLLFLVSAYFWRRQDMPSFMHSESYLIRTFYRIIVACLGVLATLALSIKYIAQNNSTRLLSIFLCLGQMTLGIYACHFFIISLVLQTFSDLWYPIKIVVTFFIVTILSYAVIKILNLNRYTTFYLLGITKNNGRI